ncbi:hypothetical protein D3C73_1671310 [compost metagenome]
MPGAAIIRVSPGFLACAAACSAGGIWLVVWVRSNERSSTQRVWALPKVVSSGLYPSKP